MSDLDTIARRHAQELRSVAQKSAVPVLEPRPRPAMSPTTVLVMVALVAIGLAVLAQVLFRPVASRPEPARNGMILNGWVTMPDVVAPPGQEAVDLNLASVFVGDFPSMTWAPDGRRLAVIGMEGRLVILETDSERPQLELTLDVECPCNIDWAPDGSAIAVSHSAEVLIVDTTTWTASPFVLDGGGLEIGPASWSPDSEWIAFAYSDGTRDRGIAKARRDGSDLTILTRGGLAFANLDWSPVSDRIAAEGLRPIDELEMFLTLVMIDADGSNYEEVADMGRCFCTSRSPGLTWSPDGTMLALNIPDPTMTQSSPQGDDWGLYLINPDGSGLRRIAGAQSGSPAWQPLP